ncbi:MFS transporter [Nitrogeniibacter mangrovi]|uniref:MFS transporter n=1 Tax=Nitrogeniibacter mangrovi TaxID=2016596 RepID=A0A6C1B4Y4_9RHOO|nr:MFS transporter [Nitrogeniibacter mangrovi]QID17925.1 MFS transporter [Nitrogeniibacter mangrovi]
MARSLPETTPTRPANPARRQAWRALGSPAYRHYFFGQLLSLVGTWIQQVALGWLVYRLTDSTVLLGAVAFLSNAPQLMVAPFAGIIIDRSDRKRLMLQVQTLMLAQAVFLAVFTYVGWITPWLILVAAGVLGVLNSFDAPLRHSLAGQLVPRREDIPNAIALNTLTFNVARFIGPPAAGLLLAATSAAVCFAVNGVSFLALILALRRLAPSASPAAPTPFGTAMREGFGYVRSSVPVRMLLTQVALLNFFAASYLPMMPAFARDVFAGGPNTLGVLLGSAGAGALVASAYLMSRPSVRGLTGSILHANLLAGVSLTGFALTDALWLALVQLFLLGFSMIVCNASTNTILQTILPEGLRGRVLALYTAANLGAAAVGGLLVGWVGGLIGPEAALLAAGLLLMGAGARFYLRLESMRVHLRPLYAAQGIAPRSSE